MSDATPDAPAPDAPAPDAPPEPTAAELKADAEKWKELARKHEERAKGNATAARELEQLRQQSMSDTEKAAAVARTEGRNEALREVGGRLVDASVKIAAAGRPVDVDALLEGLDRSRFLTEEGEPDERAIQTWVDRIAPPPDPNAKPGFPDLGQGVRTNGGAMPLNGDPIENALKDKLGI